MAIRTLAEILNDMDVKDIEAAFNEPLPMATPPTKGIGPPSPPHKVGVVEVGKVKVELVGGNRETVIKQSRRYLGRLTYCYNVYLRDLDQDLKGRLAVYWKIEDGQVTEARVLSNEMDDEDFAECVQTKVMRWRYPKATRADVNQSFAFDHSVERSHVATHPPHPLHQVLRVQRRLPSHPLSRRRQVVHPAQPLARKHPRQRRPRYDKPPHELR